MKRIAAIILLLTVPAFAADPKTLQPAPTPPAPAPTVVAAPTLKLPAEVKGRPGAWVIVVPEAKDGGEVKWKLGLGLTQVSLDKLFPGLKPAGVVVEAPQGVYEVWAWCAKGDVASELAVTRVIIGDPLPQPTPPGPGPGPMPPATPSPATAVTYVYEKDQHAIPNPVLAALNRLNRERRIVATAIEVDSRTGTGQVPEQYKLPLAAAKEAGLPALVVTGGGKVLAVVKNPTSEAAVMEAVK